MKDKGAREELSSVGLSLGYLTDRIRGLERKVVLSDAILVLECPYCKHQTPQVSSACERTRCLVCGKTLLCREICEVVEF